MSKQLLIYSEIQAVSSSRHRDWSIKRVEEYDFARDVNSVPLMAVEFTNTASEMAIVFSGDKDEILPVVVLGLRAQENLFLDKKGQMTSRYIPAFLRRYPFVFSSEDDGTSFTLCLDESYVGCNQDGLGERFFDNEGESTQYLKQVLEFLKEYQVQFNKTKNFCKKLKEYDLLEPMGAQFVGSKGEKLTLTGFMTVNREKLKSLSQEMIVELTKADEMELIYVHLQSLRNLNEMVGKISKSSDTGSKVKENKVASGKSKENKVSVKSTTEAQAIQ